MAYMVDGKGPYPNKAGEFCGNHHPESRPFPGVHEKEYLATMRLGLPRPCKATYVTAENGWVGLYLKEDRPLRECETPCETPPELLEPPSA